MSATASGIDKDTLDIVKEMRSSDPTRLPAELRSRLVARMAKVRVDSIRVRFEDAGLARKALRMAAGPNAPVANVVSGLVMGAEARMAALGWSEAFRRRTLSALAAFLDEPRSLTVQVSPPSEVGALGTVFAGVAAGMLGPESLGVVVTANGP